MLITTAALPAGCQLQLRTGGCCTELLSYTGTAVQTGAKTKAEAGKIWTGLLAGFVCLFTKCFCYVGLKALVLKWQLSGCSCTSAKVFPLLQMLTAQRRNKLPYYEIVILVLLLILQLVLLHLCHHFNFAGIIIPLAVRPFEILWAEQVLEELKPGGTGLA